MLFPMWSAFSNSFFYLTPTYSQALRPRLELGSGHSAMRVSIISGSVRLLQQIPYRGKSK